MRIVFFGTPQIAADYLKAILNTGHEVVGVVTKPDTKSGRGQLLANSSVKKVALDNNLCLFQPDNLDEITGDIRELKPDLFIVISFGKKISSDILAIPKFYAINVHFSLLPRYRGAAPVNWSLINGEKESGITIFKISEKIDSGDIIEQRRVKIEKDDDAVSLLIKLEKLGINTLLNALKKIESNKINLKKQNEKYASYAPKLVKEDGLVNWNFKSEAILNRARGLVPWPGAYCVWENKIIKLWKMKALENSVFQRFHPEKRLQSQRGILCKKVAPGFVAETTKKSIIVKTADGFMAIEELQLEGSRRMSSELFLIGHRIETGDKFFKD